MRRDRLIRFAAWVLPPVAVLALVHAPTPSPGTERIRTVSTTYPTNAAKIFRWGNAAWHDEFVDPLSATWKVNKPGQVRDQHGMLTLDATPRGGTVTATATGHNQRYGRWEARVRGRQYGTGATPFHVLWELVPMDSGGYHCGARSLMLSDYQLGRNHADVHVRNLPDADFTAGKWLPLDDDQFHTYAIEVTPDHVSWFVDTRVVMTERRSAARSGALFAPRFRLAAQPGATMNQGRMQMDWVRYYTLHRPDARSIEAPSATAASYGDAC